MINELYDKLKVDLGKRKKVVLSGLLLLLAILLETRGDYISTAMDVLPVNYRAYIITSILVMLVAYAGVADKIIDWILTEQEKVYLLVLNNKNEEVGWIEMTPQDWRRQTIKNANQAADFISLDNQKVYIAKYYDWVEEEVWSNWREAADPVQVERAIAKIRYNEDLYQNEIQESRELTRSIPAIKNLIERRSLKRAQRMVDSMISSDENEPIENILDEHLDHYDRLNDDDMERVPLTDLDEDEGDTDD